jgi:hypothetical protein
MDQMIYEIKIFSLFPFQFFQNYSVTGPRTSSIRVTTVSATKRKLILQNFDFSVTELTNSTSNKVENPFEKLNVHKPVDVQCCFLKSLHHRNHQ